jgi:hypothetical protein
MHTYTKLRDGSWGIRSTEQVAPGATVLVERRDGVKKYETVSAVVWSGNGVWLSSIQPKSSPKVSAETPVETAPVAKPKTSSRPAGWRPCGYPGCNPSYCDECDGKGAGRNRHDW